MANLSIKQVPEPLLEKLRRRAAGNHRSLQGELMSILVQALEADATSHTRAGGQARGAIGSGVLIGSRTIEEIGAEVRRQTPQPDDDGPLAVDVIRRERDARG